MEYKTVSHHIKRLQQTGVYAQVSLASKTECQWEENVHAVQQEVTTFRDRRATVHEARQRADVAEQWDASCEVEQDKVQMSF